MLAFKRNLDRAERQTFAKARGPETKDGQALSFDPHSREVPP